jgi:Icc-related predicted phosphoesterase
VTSVVRVAAVADLHMRPVVRGKFRPAFTGLADHADLLLLAGDLTNGGTPQEAELLCEEVAGLPVPAVAVLGNHDHDEGYGAEMTAMLERSCVRVLDGNAVTLDVAGVRLGVAGLMGGGGGFPTGGSATATELSQYEQERRRRGPVDAERLRAALDTLDPQGTDLTIALLHFAPIIATLVGEPPEIYPSLGCHAFAEVIDQCNVDLVVHGHAHSGSEAGATPRGVQVRNVAHPVLCRPYAVYELATRRARDELTTGG